MLGAYRQIWTLGFSFLCACRDKCGPRDIAFSPVENCNGGEELEVWFVESIDLFLSEYRFCCLDAEFWEPRSERNKLFVRFTYRPTSDAFNSIGLFVSVDFVCHEISSI